MKQTYHILNGDALREQLPKELAGDIIVARECLADGPVSAGSLKELFAVRAEFIATAYAGYSKAGYYEQTVPELEKIRQLPENAEVNLWFEDDLFCQVNLWFVLHLLKESGRSYSIFLIRPKPESTYGFGDMSSGELTTAFHHRSVIPLSDLQILGRLWQHYQREEHEALLRIGRQLSKSYPFLLPAIEAHTERLPDADTLGRPKQSLLRIMEELETEEFAPVFREFCRRETIYGFGDLQVKRLLDEIKAEFNPES